VTVVFLLCAKAVMLLFVLSLTEDVCSFPQSSQAGDGVVFHIVHIVIDYNFFWI
jgi:hypothetical protein